MIPVLQTVKGVRGNCFAAAMASILHLGIEELPDVTALDLDGPAWWEVHTRWLSEHGLSALLIDESLPPPMHPTGFGVGIAVGTHGHNHAVVTLGRQVIFDPSGAVIEGHATPPYILILVPRNPAYTYAAACAETLIGHQRMGHALQDACEVARLYQAARDTLGGAAEATEEAFALVNDATERMVQSLDELEAVIS